MGENLPNLVALTEELISLHFFQTLPRQEKLSDGNQIIAAKRVL
jgi:hypothetical protein